MQKKEKSKKDQGNEDEKEESEWITWQKRRWERGKENLTEAK